METIKLKKTDISRILRSLELLELKREINKKDYTRLSKLLFKKLR